VDFRLTPDQQAWRDEVESFLRATTPARGELPGDPSGAAYMEAARAFGNRLAAKGWLAPAWPKDYGGLGLDLWKQVIYKEALALHGAPTGYAEIGIDLVGPTLMVYGTEEQKQRYLPAMLRNEEWWGQGFSEPNSGSDLASLSMRAEVDGDDFVVNGTKIWTTGGYYADQLFLLVRTDPEAPKHRGISYLLVDAHAPGVTIKPLDSLGGEARLSQMFFENVRIRRANLVGELNRGWYVAMTTLDFERSGIEWPSNARRHFAALRDELRRSGALSDPRVALTVAERAIEIEVSRLMCYNIVSLQSAGRVPNHEASVGKVFGSEMTQRLIQASVSLLGLHGQLFPGSPHARLDGVPAFEYLATLSDTIRQGTSEIQRGIIAGRGLGLPRG